MVSAQAILVISHDVIGPQMAGPGIRYRELARVLAENFPVILAVPSATNIEVAGVELWPYQPGVWESLQPAVARAKAILLCGDVLAWFPQLAHLDVPLIVDGYDPHTLEILALFAGKPEQKQAFQDREAILQMQCALGDFFICASERQRDWWLGLLESSGRVNAATYNDDVSLRKLIDVVPFGLSSLPPQHTTPVLKGVWPGIGLEDKVILWGGGLWQWLDPLTAVRAMVQIREQRDDVRLVFPGTRHPNPVVPVMPMVEQAGALADQLGLLDQYVFFGDWVAYQQWPNYLLEADVGLSLHFDTLETRMAFRTRMLDYIWAGLPMVVTGGDATSTLVNQFDLGYVVDYEAVADVATAILTLLDRATEDWSLRFERIREQFTWENSARALIDFCVAPYKAADYQKSEEATSAESTDIVLARQAQEIARLRALVTGYEQGRFIRLMKWWHQLWSGREL